MEEVGVAVPASHEDAESSNAATQAQDGGGETQEQHNNNAETSGEQQQEVVIEEDQHGAGSAVHEVVEGGEGIPQEEGHDGTIQAEEHVHAQQEEVHHVHVEEQQHDELHHGEKRPREEYLDGDLLAQQYSEDVLKKAKLDEEHEHDGIMPVPAMGLPYFTTTGNIKSPLFEGIPSLTPEWLLKKVWLKVNGELEANVMASLISKDMGPKLRLEIRSHLEKRSEVVSGSRINLKQTIMQAIEMMVAHQEKPMLMILRDAKLKPRKEGKSEKNFAVALTPYGQAVCINDLQLKKRDAANPLRSSTPSKGLSMSSLGSSDSLTASQTLSDSAPAGVSAASQFTEHSKWDPIAIMRAEIERLNQVISEYRHIILSLKPDYPLNPAHTDNVLLEQLMHANAQQQTIADQNHEMMMAMQARYIPHT